MNKDINSTLETWLQTSGGGYTVKGIHINYYSLYENLKRYLLPKEEETTKGAIIADIDAQIKSERERIEALIKSNSLEEHIRSNLFKLERLRWLNDHGPRHIETVIKRATQLLGDKEKVSPKEIYWLLCAIHLHDLGNFYGRAGHEQNIYEVIKDGIDNIGADQIERKYILEIAGGHGGYKPGTKDKDTISRLKVKVPVLDEYVHLRLLAAILRFADELADEKSRADQNLLDNRLLPKSSEVFHAYSACLNSVIIDHPNHAIELHFDIPQKYLNRKFGKDDSEIHIIDYIYERVFKMHFERIYCARFWKPYISIEQITVLINFYPDSMHEELHPELTFCLSENGYPKSSQTIYEMCPKLIGPDGSLLDGDHFLKICK